MMNKRAAIYARVSTDVQRDNYSIPSQINECTQYIQDHDYHLVGNQYVDPESGQDTHKGNGALPAFVDDYTSRELSRPSLDSCINFLENFGFDILVIHSLDRLARDPYIRQTLEMELSAFGAKVQYVLGSYEESAEGEVRKDLDAVFGKWENAKRVERSNRGKRRKAESGLFVGACRVPFGYCRDEESLAGLAIDESQAATVRQIFQLYVSEGFSIRGIAEELTKQKIENHSGVVSWGKSSVRRIITNSIYAGRTYYNRQKRQGKKLIERNRDEWIEILTLPIVDDWTFQEAQNILRKSFDSRRHQSKRFYLLSGIVFCAECQRPYSSQTAKAGKHRRLNDAQSYRHRVKEGHCINRMVSARKLEPIVWDVIKGILLDPDSLRKGYEESLERQKSAYARQRSHLKTLNSKLFKIDEKIRNLTEAYIDPDISLPKPDYIEKKSEIDNEKKNIIHQIEILEGEFGGIPEPAELKTIEVFSKKVIQGMDIIEPMQEEKRKILDLLHVKVNIRMDGGIMIDGWFNPDSEWLSATTS